jgi:DNA ligase-associated metallophosphoesterase
MLQECVSASFTLGAQGVQLHPERAVSLPNRQVLVIADVHWGKATTLRAFGAPVPAGGTSADLRRLDAVLRRTEAKELIVLGDLAHSRHGWDQRALQPVLAWRDQWPDLQITLVRGNHDAHAGDPPPSLDIHCVDAPLFVGSLRCKHEPPETAHEGFTLCGHLHPHVTLRGKGRDRVRLPCFVRGEHSLMLPAFSSFTGGGAWTPQEGDVAYAIVDDAIVSVAP